MDAPGGFDTSHFTVRIMSSDFQSSEDFSANIDSHVILSEKKDDAFAYVHYFCLNDINARGYIRQFCLSYVTAEKNKLTDNFEALVQAFSVATMLFKCGNHTVFKADVEQRLTDLEYTIEVLKEEGWYGKDDMDESERYKGFDFTSDDVPERDDRVVQKSMDEIKGIMKTLNTEMEKEENKKTQRFIDTYHPEECRTTFRSTVGEGSQPVNSFPGDHDQPPAYEEVDSCPLRQKYQAKRVMAHMVNRFNRKLRTLQDLSTSAYQIGMAKLREIQKFFAKSNFALLVEKEETALLDRWASLLTIGRIPMLNAFQHYRPSSPRPDMTQQSCRYYLSCKNSPLQNAATNPPEVVEETPSCGFDTRFAEDGQAFVRCPLYLDAVPTWSLPPSGTMRSRPALFSVQPDDSPYATPRATTPDTVPSPEDRAPNPSLSDVGSLEQSKGYSSGTMVEEVDGTGEEGQNMVPSESRELFGSARGSPLNEATLVAGDGEEEGTSAGTSALRTISKPHTLKTMQSVESTGNFYSPTSGVPLYVVPSSACIFPVRERQKAATVLEVSRRALLPFISSVDRIEKEKSYLFKPGRGVCSLYSSCPMMGSLLYCLLHGRPLVIIGTPKDDKLIRRFVRMLWLFVPGHSSQHQVIPLINGTLTAKELSMIKLVGLVSEQGLSTANLPFGSLKKYISYLDCATGKFCTPPYKGELLNPIVTKNRDRKENEGLYLAHIHSVLLSICMKAFVYYHGYCLQAGVHVAGKAQSTHSSRKKRAQFLEKLQIHDSDVDIIEHLVEVLRFQQLAELKGANGAEDVMNFKFVNRLSKDEYYKPKAPY
eukprot:Em0023g468a